MRLCQHQFALVFLLFKNFLKPMLFEEKVSPHITTTDTKEEKIFKNLLMLGITHSMKYVVQHPDDHKYLWKLK